MTAVIAVIRRDPPRWRRGPCPGGDVSSARPSVRIVRLFVRSQAAAAAIGNAEPTTSDRGEDCPLPSVPGVEIVQGCHVRAEPLGPPLASGRRAGGSDRGLPQVETALAAAQAVRGQVRPASRRTCGLRAPYVLRVAHACVSPASLDSAIMRGERCALLWEAHSSVRLVSAIVSGTRMCPPHQARLRHHVRRALRASAGGTRKCPLLWEAHTSVRLVSASSPANVCVRLVRLVSVILCGERCAHLRAAHKCVPAWSALVSTTMCGGYGTHLWAVHASVRPVIAIMCEEHGAHTSVRLVSVTMCGERCALLRAAHTSVRPVTAITRGGRASDGGTRLASAIMHGERCALLRADHTSVRLVSATMCGERRAHLRTALVRTHLVSATVCGERCALLLAARTRAARRSARCPPLVRHHERRHTARYAGGTRTCPPRQLLTRA